YTSRLLLCRLWSIKLNIYYLKPFNFVSLKASEKKYRKYYKQFVIFIFRAFWIPFSVRRRLTGICFIKR
ncbi:hypothetical protein DL95DRAFT_316855, partial [Leptodontidium sp. 2 PMI_412]